MKTIPESYTLRELQIIYAMTYLNRVRPLFWEVRKKERDNEDRLRIEYLKKHYGRK